MKRSHVRTPDYGRMGAAFRGKPKNYVSYGTVGHVDQTPQYARVEDGDVLVEVTLAPSGDEVVARLDFNSVDGGGFYMPLSYGQRVLVAFPQGEGGEAVIIARLADTAWPFPPDVADVPTESAGSAPMYCFLKTQDGQLIAIETGDGADFLVHSGGSTWQRVEAGEQHHIQGRTHIGSDAEPLVPPVPPQVAPGGFTTPGAGLQGYIPLPNSNVDASTGIPIGPLIDNLLRVLPEDGLVRIKDTVQVNSVTDKPFIDFQIYVFTWLEAANIVLDSLTGNAWSAALQAALGAAGVVAPTAPPLKADGKPISGSNNTASDD